jgi:hypothetical protein
MLGGGRRADGWRSMGAAEHMEDEAGRRGAVSRRWIGVAVILVVGVALQLAALQTHRNETRVTAAAGADRALERDRTAELRVAQAQVVETRREAQAAGDALEVVRYQLAAVGSSEAAVAADVAAAKTALATLQDDLTKANDGLGATGLQLIGLSQCVSGGQQALDLAATASTAAAAKALDASRAACDPSATAP